MTEHKEDDINQGLDGTELDDELPRKWEYVARKCHEHGDADLGEIAEKIDAIIVKHYGNAHTLDWLEDYEIVEDYGDGEAQFKQVLFLASSWKNCTPCFVHGFAYRTRMEACVECKFGQEAGDCTDIEETIFEKKSLYQQFFHVARERYNAED